MLFLKQNLHKEEAKKQVEVCGGRGDCHSKGHSEKTCCVRVKKITSLNQNSAVLVCRTGKVARFHRSSFILPASGEK